MNLCRILTQHRLSFGACSNSLGRAAATQARTTSEPQRLRTWSSGAAALAVAALLASAVASPALADTRLYVPNPYSDPFWDVDLPQNSGLVPPPWFTLSGQLRMRGGLWRNLDLSRGVTPSTGNPIAGTFATEGNSVGSADMRLTLDPVINVGPEVSIHIRLNLLENLVLGSTPQSYPASPEVPFPGASTSQTAPQSGRNSLTDSITVGRLWMEWLSPVGLVFAGRMGMDWGLGLVANSGDCADCDVQQVADTVGLATSVLDHMVVLSYSWDASGGHLGTAGDPSGALMDISDSDDMQTVSLAIGKYLLPAVTRMKVRQGAPVFLWGLSGSWRWQEKDMPAYYLTAPEDWDGQARESEYVDRDLDAVVVDGWFRFWYRSFRLEGEAAWMGAWLGESTLLPGVNLGEASANQWGGVIRGRLGVGGGVELRMEMGVASGDDAFGFGVNSSASYYPQAGDIEGSQADFKDDRTVDNFRFNSNYHVDEILWRRIIGTVSDAMYLRPGLDWAPADWVRFDGTLVYSRAMEAMSTPGLARNLGMEADLGCTLSGKDGLFLRGTAAWFLPFDGFRNVAENLDPESAWALRLVGGVRF